MRNFTEFVKMVIKELPKIFGVEKAQVFAA
jgi:hypothetical protein